MSTEVLLGCPFCGGEAALSDAESGSNGLSRAARNPRCKACGADLGYCETSREAIAAWNRRAPDPKVAALVEAGREAESALLAAFSEISELANILSREPATSGRCYQAANDLRAALQAIEGEWK